jgi:predicted nucleic acid-binding protein
VSNSGPILSFARARRFDLLREVVGTLTIPEAVYADIVVRGAGKLGAEDVQYAAWITRTPVRDRTFVDQLPQRLHLGEREALTLAHELDAVLLIDEREARRVAQQYGIAHFGSWRILEEAKERGLILTVKPVLDELITAGTFISESLYRTFLRTIGEEDPPSPSSEQR